MKRYRTAHVYEIRGGNGIYTPTSGQRAMTTRSASCRIRRSACAKGPDHPHQSAHHIKIGLRIRLLGRVLLGNLRVGRRIGGTASTRRPR
jgi:hypothetical protein